MSSPPDHPSQPTPKLNAARLIRSVQAAHPSPPEWIQAGQRVQSKRHGQGVITQVIGYRVFTEFETPYGEKQEITYASWRQILEGGDLQPRPGDTAPEASLPPGIPTPIPSRFQAELARIPDPVLRSVVLEWVDLLSALECAPAVEARWQPLPPSFHPHLSQALQTLGYTRLYSHQAEAFAALQAGQDVMLTTPTASGKTLSYTPAVVNACLHDPHTTALYLFPLKALALDQVQKLQQLNQALPKSDQLRLAMISGDTPKAERQRLFHPDPPQIFCTSPDLVHHQLYRTSRPEGESWRRFLQQLRFVILDEAHTYTSVMGSHLANLMRRLRLAVDQVGGDSQRLQYVLGSATLGNPRQLALSFTGRTLTPERLHLIEESGASVPERIQVCLQPSFTPNPDAAEIVISWLQKGLSGIVFLNTRSGLKTLLGLIQERLNRLHLGHWTERVALFHGSLPDLRRRQILEGLKLGSLQVILSTSALEAGIDLPALDCCLMRGYPGSLMAFRQRQGRAGRQRPGLVLFLPMAQNPLDAFYGRFPQELLHGSPEQAVFNADYPITLGKHLVCAACESGIPSHQVEAYFGTTAGIVAGELLDQHQISRAQGLLRAGGYPHGDVNLRGSVQERIALIEQPSGEPMEELTLEVAYREVYPGALYTTQADDGSLRFYRVRDLEVEQRRALLDPLPEDPKTITQAEVESTVRELERLSDPRVVQTEVPEGRLRLTLFWGELVTTVRGYQRLSRIYDHSCSNPRCGRYHQSLSPGSCPSCRRSTHLMEITKPIERIPFEADYQTRFEAPVLRLEMNPPLQLAMGQAVQDLQAQWQVTPEMESHPLIAFKPEFLALHSAAHQICLAAPLLVLGSVQDLNCWVDPSRPAPVSSLVYFYDAYDGGNGLCETLLERFREFAKKALTLAQSCDCEQGCPRCLTYHGCPQNNEGLLKQMGIRLLQTVELK